MSHSGAATSDFDIAKVQQRAEGVLSEELYWFPVRHHSPAAARHLQAAIRARKPRLVLIEGPAHASELIQHIVDGKTKPPVAVYSSYRDDNNVLGLAGIASAAPDIPARFPVWYPLMSYSPEYVAMKEGRAVGADVAFIDLPDHAHIDVSFWRARAAVAGDDADEDSEDAEFDEGEDENEHEFDSPLDTEEQTPERKTWESIVVESGFYQVMAKAAGYRNWSEAWDAMFEVGHRHATYEEFRRDLAYFCSAVRATTPKSRIESDGTLLRERFMWRAVADEIKKRKLKPSEVMIVCGGFHLFLDRDDKTPPPEIPKGTTLATVVPYSSFRISELSGYGAGNRAPRFYQCVWDHMGSEEPWVGAMVEHVTSVLAKGRHDGEMFSSADAISVTQHARLLASLRNRPVPILDDIRDALISCCCKGKPEEEGRGLLKAMASAEIGTAIGRVTPAMGRVPILHDFESQLSDLELGEVMGKDKRLVLSLDLREEVGARRSAFFHRLAALEIPLAELESAPTGDGATLFREKWRLTWSPKVEPELIEKNLYGDTIETAAMAQLEEQVAKEARHAGGTCARLRESVTMQLPQVMQRLEVAAGAAIDEDRHFNSQCEALVHLLVMNRLAVAKNLGRESIRTLATRSYTRACLAIADVVAIPVDEQEPVIAHLKSLAEAVLSDEFEFDKVLFTDSVKSAAVTTEVPFMQGAFAGLLAELRELDPKDLAWRVAAFATSHPTRMVLAGEFLDGAFAVSKTSILLGADALVGAIDELLKAAPWDEFMTLLPKVRRAFERLHDRQRLSFADRVAVRYGLQEGEEVMQVKAASAEAAASMASVDTRVAAIMQEWTF